MSEGQEEGLYKEFNDSEFVDLNFAIFSNSSFIVIHTFTPKFEFHSVHTVHSYCGTMSIATEYGSRKALQFIKVLKGLKHSQITL